jgi:hypothetical protein
MVIIGAVVVLSSIGLIALIVYLLTPSSPILQPECGAFDKEFFNLWLLPRGLAQFLLVLLVAAFGRTSAASVRLQAIISPENT